MYDYKHRNWYCVMWDYCNVSVGLVLLRQQESWPVCSVHSTAEQPPSEVRTWLHRWQLVWLASGDCSDYRAAALNRVAWKWYKIRAIAAIKELNSCQCRWHNKSDINRQVDKEQTFKFIHVIVYMNTGVFINSLHYYRISSPTTRNRICCFWSL